MPKSLYKNVDLCDLQSIISQGVLSLDESGNGNWWDGNRADNRTDLVYLFSPVEGRPNSFPNYGVALLEVDSPEAVVSEFLEGDFHKGDYVEYVSPKISPDKIRRIYVPEIFKRRIGLPREVVDRIDFCGFSATLYKGDSREAATEQDLRRFAETAEIFCSEEFNFFRGENADRTVIDLYDIMYIF